MKKSLVAAMLPGIFLTLLASCAKPVSDAELKQAYLFYIEAPATLTKLLSSSNTDSLIAESLSDDSGTYIRSTEINQADKRAKITTTFKDFHPKGTESVTINGEVILTNLGNKFFLNGELRYEGIKPAKLVFKNIQLEQKNEAGESMFVPIDGIALADSREITGKVLFTDILK